MISSATAARSVTMVLALASWGCEQGQPEASAESAAIQPPAEASQALPTKAVTAPSRAEQARAKLAPLKTQLKAALMAAAQGGHLEQAVTACQVQAPLVTGAQTKDGVRMGRSALKLRNPDNVSPQWVTPLMEELSKDASSESISREVSLPKGRFGYVEAIYTMPMCEGCHGTKIKPAVTARLNELYPQDAATGFSSGSFRGVFWVELPAE